MSKSSERKSIFDDLMVGLDEGIAHARGELTLRTTTLPAPAPKLSKRRVVAIRKKAGMSQAVFASYLNVPTRTLQSWEQGLREPKAGEARLLQIADESPEQFVKLVSATGKSRSGTTRRARPARAPTRPRRAG